MIISIDIGTSYSSICMSGPDGKAQPVDISTGASMFGGKYSLPTAVFVEDNGTVLIGQAAINCRKRNPRNFCMEFKRNFGEEAPILLSGRGFKPEELYMELFRHMKSCAEKARGEQVELAFLTCPASYGEARKEKLCSAAKAAGLFQVELVDEPVAAAMCYCAGGYIQDGQNLLVYDFGGGTFDVSLLEYRNGAFRLLSEPEGLEQCGGADMDHLILEDMLRVVGQEIIEELKKNQMHYLRFTSQLAEMAVRAKHHLSAAEAFEEDIVIGFDMVPYRLTVEQFNKMIAPLVDETVQLCRQAVKNAGISETDISAVLMAGGSSRVPLVREMASRIAPDASLLCAVDLELAVAQGALEYRRFAASKPGAAAKQGQRGELSAKAGTGRRPEGDVEEWFRKGKEAEEREDEEEVVEWYRRAAEAGHAEAMYELGVCYDCGYGVLEDEEKAVEWYDKAAEAGHAEAMYELGKCYDYGYGVPEDDKQAYYWYCKSVEAGCSAAFFYMALAYQFGTGTAVDYRQAVNWYRRDVEENNGCVAAKKLGEIYEKGGYGITADMEEAVRWYQKAVDLASDGNVKRDVVTKRDAAVKRLRALQCEDLDAEECFRRGREAANDGDEELACFFYHKAAKAGCIEAFFYVGQCCQHGKGTKINYKKAAKWYRKAVKIEDCCVSAYYLGEIYEEGGHGITADKEEAIQWYQKALDLGYDELWDEEDIINLGIVTAAERLEELQSEDAAEYFSRGYEAERRGDFQEAVRWYLKAADNEDPSAMYNLGVLYHNGTGVIQNYIQSFQWYCKAAYKGHVRSMYMVGVYYDNGYGMEQDYKGAVYWYRKAADEGNEDAMCNLGVRYDRGQGVSQDSKQAVSWYHKAASKGSVCAMYNLGVHYSNGQGVTQNYAQANKWYLKAAESGDTDAMNNLGIHYQYGRGVPKDIGQAVKWFKKAAEAGHEQAAENLRKLR